MELLTSLISRKNCAVSWPGAGGLLKAEEEEGPGPISRSESRPSAASCIFTKTSSFIKEFAKVVNISVTSPSKPTFQKSLR